METPDHPCGGCHMCCKLMTIIELDKPHGQWCSHCDPKQATGCSIYSARPEACIGFECMWLDMVKEGADPSRPELAALRPDRAKFLLRIDRYQGRDAITMIPDTGYQTAYQSDVAQRFISRAYRDGIPVVVKTTKKDIIYDCELPD